CTFYANFYGFSGLLSNVIDFSSPRKYSYTFVRSFVIFGYEDEVANVNENYLIDCDENYYQIELTIGDKKQISPPLCGQGLYPDKLYADVIEIKFHGDKWKNKLRGIIGASNLFAVFVNQWKFNRVNEGRYQFYWIPQLSEFSKSMTIKIDENLKGKYEVEKLTKNYHCEIIREPTKMTISSQCSKLKFSVDGPLKSNTPHIPVLLATDMDFIESITTETIEEIIEESLPGNYSTDDLKLNSWSCRNCQLKFLNFEIKNFNAKTFLNSGYCRNSYVILKSSYKNQVYNGPHLCSNRLKPLTINGDSVEITISQNFSIDMQWTMERYFLNDDWKTSYKIHKDSNNVPLVLDFGASAEINEINLDPKLSRDISFIVFGGNCKLRYYETTSVERKLKNPQQSYDLVVPNRKCRNIVNFFSKSSCQTDKKTKILLPTNNSIIEIPKTQSQMFIGLNLLLPINQQNLKIIQDKNQ
ncbi:hypothetical protein SNEBB_007558, partial [Seison nebaliae]